MLLLVILKPAILNLCYRFLSQVLDIYIKCVLILTLYEKDIDTFNLHLPSSSEFPMSALQTY